MLPSYTPIAFSEKILCAKVGMGSNHHRIESLKVESDRRTPFSQALESANLPNVGGDHRRSSNTRSILIVRYSGASPSWDRLR